MNPKMGHTYAYPRPAVTVDCVIFGENLSDKPQGNLQEKSQGNPQGNLQEDSQKKLLLIQRKHAPFAGYWALPGGFVDEQESPDDAANRELQEETGVFSVKMTQFYTFGTPHRDPRGWTISIAYWAIINIAEHRTEAADDAAAVAWFALDELPQNLAFDHAEIIAKAAKNLLFIR